MRTFYLFHSLLYPQDLKQCLPDNRHLIFILQNKENDVSIKAPNTRSFIESLSLATPSMAKWH